MQHCMTTDTGSRVVWLDVRGNHDTFGVKGPRDSENLFETHGVSKQRLVS